MKRLVLPALLILLLTGAGMLFPDVRLRYCNIEASGNVKVVWETEVEQEVYGYEIQRRTPYSNGQFATLNDTPIAAVGVGKPYTYEDGQLYKAASEPVDYRLVAIFTDGSRKNLYEAKINYTPTAVRRTWGSIKAMFQ